MRDVFNIGFSVFVSALIMILIPGVVRSGVPESDSNRVAVVNGVDIERREFDDTLFKIQQKVMKYGRPLTSAQVVTLSKEVLEGLIRREILFQESRKKGIKFDKKAVDREVLAIERQFPGKADFERELARSHVTEQILRDRLEKNSAVQRYIEREFKSGAEVTGSQMVDFYDSRLNLFKQPLQVKGSHILIHIAPEWKDTKKREAMSKAKRILKKLKGGADFATIATEESDGPTRTGGGSLGYVRMGQLDKPLEKVFFALKPGEISRVVESSYGYHIFRVEKRKPETILPYDSVRDKIRETLLRQMAREKAELYAKTVRENADIRILVKNF